MIPVGYMYKTIIHEPHWLKAANVDGIYSLSGCISKNFTDYIKYWKHNGYWLFNSPAVMEEIARKSNLVLAGPTLFTTKCSRSSSMRIQRNGRRLNPTRHFPQAWKNPPRFTWRDMT